MKTNERIQALFKKLKTLHYQSTGIKRLMEILPQDTTMPDYEKNRTIAGMLKDWIITLHKMGVVINALAPLTKDNAEAVDFINRMQNIINIHKEFIAAVAKPSASAIN